MQEIIGNIFEIDADAVCITTNGFVKNNGEGVMGAGVAKQAATIIPSLPLDLGRAIQLHGNKTQIMRQVDEIYLVAFPTKDVSGVCDGTNIVSHASYKVGATVPGFHLKSTIGRIVQSCHELNHLAYVMGWYKVLLTRAGCGNGGLDWNDVKPVMAELLDDRFIIINPR